MCGIALIVGPGANRALFDRMMASIRPRGDVEETLCEEGRMLGTQRLRIVDRDHSVQPWVSADQRWALCYNGEVFNYRELRDELTALGHQLRSTGDTEVVLESFLEWGEEAVHHLRGEFAFAVVERETGRVYVARDPIGVKPLYWSHQGGRLNVASEVKALVPAGAAVVEVAPGHAGWGSPQCPPELSPYVDLMRLAEGEDPIDDPEEAGRRVREALVDSIRVRVDTDLTVGVILSGGLDSTLTLLHVQEMHPDCVAFTVGTGDSDDLRFARQLARELGVHHEIVELRPGDIRLSDIRSAIRMAELTEYGDVINSVVSRPLFERVHRCGVKVVLSGDGSDELFGGYSMYQGVGAQLSGQLFRHSIRNLSRTELQRVDRMSMGQGVEARVPFLDLSLVKLALQIPLDLKVRDGMEKWILRTAFADILPDYVRQRPKNPMSHASGLHERIRLYRPLFARTYRSFGYDVAEPMRRDFSSVLERNGLDLDRALAAPDLWRDYSAAEHARDLAGAVKWNLTAAARRLSGPRS
ncbi:MAG TPA: asparagine synthase-related protein [Acidimicrobiales bacterium]|nr:asparagine synthase-related protein [Acidimicrobiales bacterium]